MSTSNPSGNRRLSMDAKSIISTLRALAISRKGPAKIGDLMKDFRDLEGKDFNFRTYGYGKLEEFLLASEEFDLTKIQGETFIVAKSSKNSAHISKMVAKQKPVKKRPTNMTPLRTPKVSDQSWNKTSFSKNVYENLKKPRKNPPNNDKSHRMFRRTESNDKNNNNNNNKNNDNIKAENNKAHSTRSNSSNCNNTNSNNSNSNKESERLKNDQKLTNNMPSTFAPKSTVNLGHSSTYRPILGQNNNQVQRQKNLQNRLQTNKVAVSKNDSIKKPLAPNNETSVQNNVGVKATNTTKDQSSQPNKNTMNTGDSVSSSKVFKKPSIQERLKINRPENSGDMGEVCSEPILLKTESNKTVIKESRQYTNETVINKQFNKPYEFDRNADPIASLAEYCTANKYEPPDYKCSKLRFNKRYQGGVEINGVRYLCYPEEFNTRDEAMLACARTAIDQIILEEANKRFPVCLDSEYEVASKIHDELKQHPHGVFCKNIPEIFREKFGQSLPENWFSIIKSMPQLFCLEKITDDNLIVFASNKDSCTSSAASISSDSEYITLDRLVLPWENKYWNLYITSTVSTVEIWARIVDSEYSGKLEALLIDIEVAMLTDKVRPTAISCGQIYLVCLSECWYRIQVQDMAKDIGECLCFFIDEGEEKWFKMDEIYICEPRFLRLPAQAIQFSLFGLEDFAENPNAKRHLDTMLARKVLIGEILTKKSAIEEQGENGSDFESKIQVALYDTSSDEDVNLNPLILNQICDDTPTPELKRAGYTNVNVTHICDNGDVYVQVKNIGPTYVEKLIHQLVESKFQKEKYKISEDDLRNFNELFFIRDVDDGSKWYRAVLIDEKQIPPELKMFFVDYGYTKYVNLSNVFRLSSLSAALSKFPRQALKIRLHNLPPIDKTVVARIRGLLPPNSQTFVKLAVFSAIPHVIVYKRFENNDNLFNVNDVIQVDYELEFEHRSSLLGSKSSSSTDMRSGIAPEFSLNNLNRSIAKSPITIPASPKRGELPKLDEYLSLPGVGDLFEVNVAMASHPGNFFVQPNIEGKNLRVLMEELQKYCEDNDEFIPSDVIEVGEAYAAMHPDGFYHRVTVEQIYGGSMIHVRYCDFGDVSIVSNEALKTLPAKFRALPKLALVAKLHGVKAIDGDWTTNDCIRFKELVVGQQFASFVKNITVDNEQKTKILELDLIDVRTADDIYIRKILVTEGRAKATA